MSGKENWFNDDNGAMTEDGWIVMRLLVGAAHNEYGRKMLNLNADYRTAMIYMQDKYGKEFDYACDVLNKELRDKQIARETKEANNG